MAAKDVIPVCTEPSATTDAKAEPLLAAQAALPGTIRVCAVPAPGLSFHSCATLHVSSTGFYTYFLQVKTHFV